MSKWPRDKWQYEALAAELMGFFTVIITSPAQPVTKHATLATVWRPNQDQPPYVFPAHTLYFFFFLALFAVFHCFRQTNNYWYICLLWKLIKRACKQLLIHLCLETSAKGWILQNLSKICLGYCFIPKSKGKKWKIMFSCKNISCKM